jgi:hypothetical protein
LRRVSGHVVQIGSELLIAICEVWVLERVCYHARKVHVIIERGMRVVVNYSESVAGKIQL